METWLIGRDTETVQCEQTKQHASLSPGFCCIFQGEAWVSKCCALAQARFRQSEEAEAQVVWMAMVLVMQLCLWHCLPWGCRSLWEDGEG